MKSGQHSCCNRIHYTLVTLTANLIEKSGQLSQWSFFGLHIRYRYKFIRINTYLGTCLFDHHRDRQSHSSWQHGKRRDCVSPYYIIIHSRIQYSWWPIRSIYNANIISFAFLSNYDRRGTMVAGKIGAGSQLRSMTEKKIVIYTAATDWQNKDGFFFLFNFFPLHNEQQLMVIVLLMFIWISEDLRLCCRYTWWISYFVCIVQR